MEKVLQLALRHVILFLKVCPIFILFLVYCPYVCAEEAQLKIAFILPLSGEWAFLGEGVKNGGLLAKGEIDSSNLSVSFEDNKGSLSESALIANRLVASESADVIISIISGVAQVIKPIVSRAKLIQIGICSDSSVSDGRNNFINYLTKEKAAELYIKHLKELYGDNVSLGVYIQNEAGFVALLDELKDTSNLDLKFVETFNGGELDFKTSINRLMMKKPDVLLVMGLSPSL